MATTQERRRSLVVALCGAGLLLLSPAVARGQVAPQTVTDIVAVGIVDGGRAVLLATPGLARHGRRWRFRSLDTSTLPQPIRNVVLSSSGTKLFIQPAGSPGGVLDLSSVHGRRVPLEYVQPRDLSTDGTTRHTHRLPRQRFVVTKDDRAFVVDDAGVVQSEYPEVAGIGGAVSEDGAALYLLTDGTAAICGEHDSSRRECRLLPRSAATVTAVSARAVALEDSESGMRFLWLAGDEIHTTIVDPEGDSSEGSPMRRAEAALRACLMLHGTSLPDQTIATLVDALINESTRTMASGGRPVTDWRFFRVAPDVELYAPVLEFARLETVFPGTFSTLERVAETRSAGARASSDILYDRYLREEIAQRRERCTVYFWTRSTPGSWIIEYWLYYPFDVGGLGSHLHDPEHIFVEVDKLGGTVHRVIGAGHGYMAGNNFYTTDKGGAYGLTLPLYAIVELGKHAMAPDIDRDGVFTPGVDENEYRERAMIWGVRDAIGTINNEVLAYDTTMSGARRPQDALASALMSTRFPAEQDFPGQQSCRLQPLSAPEPRLHWWPRLSDFVILPPCHEYSEECAQLHVTTHPDFLDVRTILKEWTFPQAFVRATYGAGPRRGMHSIGSGYALDLDRVPALGRFLPLPGRLGADVFYWHQNVNDPDRESCIDDCKHAEGVAWGLRYEQFLSNLFGLFSAARFYTPPIGDAWFTFGPMIEAPLGKRSNISLDAGIAFRPFDSPRFELRVSVGLWKPKTNHVGLHAAGDDGRN